MPNFLEFIIVIVLTKFHQGVVMVTGTKGRQVGVVGRGGIGHTALASGIEVAQIK